MLKKIIRISLISSITISSLFAIGGSSPVYGTKGMVVSASYLASEVGAEILRAGGNAVDAAVATAFALSVTLPSAGNIGGGGFLLYRSTTGVVTTIDFREKAPLDATETMFLDKNGKIKNKSNHDGFLAIGVPGTVAGLWDAHQKYGHLNWKKIVKPAVLLAKNGFPVSHKLVNEFKYLEKTVFNKYASTRKKLTHSNGSTILENELWKQPDLASTLKLIQKEGKDGFYSGKVADKLVSFIQTNGGILTLEDLVKYEAIERKPIMGTYRDYEIWSMPPPSSGGIALVEMLNMLENYDLKSMGFQSADMLHTMTEVMRRSFLDRARYLGDSDFNDSIPIETLISKEYAKTQITSIMKNSASISDSTQIKLLPINENTTHISVIDKDGNAVSLTYTLEQNYGSKIVAEGLGFFLNNEMGDFNPISGLTNSKGLIGSLPNLILPEKRMLSSMTPTLVTKNGNIFMVIGSPGGRTIINTVFEVIINVIDFDMNIAQAIESGRFHHQWLPDVTRFENYRFSPETLEKYSNMGYEYSFRSYPLGRAMGICICPKTGLRSACADSRSPDGLAVPE